MNELLKLFKNNLKKTTVFVLVLIILIIFSYISIKFIKFSNSDYFKEELLNFVDRSGIWGMLTIFVLQVLQVVVAFLPGGPYEIVAGMLYGPWISIVLLTIAAVFASIFIFVVCKKYGRPLVLKFFNEKHIKEWSWLEDSNKLELITFIIYLIPGTPKDFLIYLMATTKIETKKFLIISNSARIPAMFASCALGSSVSDGNVKTIVIYTVLLLMLTVFSFLFRDGIISIFKKSN